MIGVFSGGRWHWRDSAGQITGEKVPGDLKTWNLLERDINEALTSSYGVLSNRSTTLYHTYAPVASAINKTTAYAVGDGNAFRSHPDYRILNITPEAAKEWGKRFQLLVHYYFNLLNWYEKQSILFRGALIGGDSLLYFVREDDGLDLVEAAGSGIDYKKTDGKTWTLGVKHDKYQRRQAIYTDTAVDFVNQATGDQQVVQFLFKEMPRQLRGLPLAYKIIALAKTHDRFLDATTQRAVLESIMFGWSNTETTDIAKQLGQQMAVASKKKRAAGHDTEVSRITGTADLLPGNMYNLRTGESLQFTDLKTPSNNFGLFNEWIIKLVAMATDTTPGVIMSNYPTSYSSHRGEFNDFWKMVLLKRSLFNKKVNKIVVREICKKLIFDGAITAPGFFDDPIQREAWLAGSWLGPVPGHINPLQEVNAHKVAVENSFQSRADIAALYGHEWENMIDEWGEQEQRFRSFGPEAQEAAIQEGVSDV